ncbi:MAG: 50S ribosomal protein L35 [Candidatus Hydrogenedentales bacterium]
MPKMKTVKSAAKRFRATKTGKFKRSKAYGRHLLSSKSPKRRRKLRKAGLISKSETARVELMLPYGKKFG